MGGVHRDAGLFHQLLITTLVMAGGAAASAADSSQQRRGCPTSCGDVAIPYPFGIGEDCSMEGFTLTCNETLKKPFWGNLEVVSISLPLGQIRMLNKISWQCYDGAGSSSEFWSLNLTDSPYIFSDAFNKFTAIGCYTLAYIINPQTNARYQSGCVAMCADKQSLVNGTCSGSGCCQTTSIPKNLEYYQVEFDPNFQNSANCGLNCSFAVLLESSWFQYRTYYSTTFDFWYENNSTVPVVLDWAIGTETCEVAQRDLTSYACVSEKSTCINSSHGLGYLCNCPAGYRGNPYIKDGCQDINECDPTHPNPCSRGAKCENLPGNYSCSCPPGTHGEAQNGTCTPDQKLPLPLIGTTGGLAVIIFCIMSICMVTERRKRINDRERYFREHGGRLLLEKMKENHGLAFKIYTKEELEKATNKFNPNQVLGRGGHGIVYKGVLQDKHTVVAVKKSNVVDENQKKEFGNEMVILSQINHKNIVKLLGCCLEMEMPMLVYEFISNGTLFHRIHNNNSSPIPLDTCLSIAYESADALAYLHSTALPPIIHGDVKSSNILLAENDIPKITDFGASKFIPKDKDQLANLVQGTCGYLDPEYFQTCRLTDKSDVYSFGVVLLEMLTRREAIYFEGSEEAVCLVSTFFSAVDENRFSDMLNCRVENERDIEVIEEIRELIEQCLNFKGDKRPTMKEVADQLHGLRKLKQPAPYNGDGYMSLLDEPNSTTYHRAESQITYDFNVKSGR